jgi:hypothetical protein
LRSSIRTNPAVQVLRLVELGAGLVEPLADALGDLLGTVRDHDRDEVVAAHMADEALGPGPLDHRVLDDARGRLDQPVAAHEPFWSL